MYNADMSTKTLQSKLNSLEQQIKVLKAQSSGAKVKKSKKFSSLYGTLRGHKSLSYEEIKEAEFTVHEKHS